MSEEQQRNGFLLFMDQALRLVDGAKGLAMILAALTVGGASGTVLAGNRDSSKTDTLSARVDTLETQMDELKGEFARSRQEAMEMYSAQLEADSTLRIILEARAANRRKAANDRASTQKLFTDIIGGTP